MSGENEVGESSLTASLRQPVGPVDVAAKPIKFKYREAYPAPEGFDLDVWNKCFTAADSRLYNHFGRKADKSQKARASGETRVLAIKMYHERMGSANPPTSTPDSITNTTPSLLPTSLPTPSLPKPSLPTPSLQTPSLQTLSLQTSSPPSASLLHPQIAPATPSAPAFKMDRSGSRDTTPAQFVFGASSGNANQTSFDFTEPSASIADTVKGKGRQAKVVAAKPSSSLPGFGPTSTGYANKRKHEEKELTDAEKSQWVDENLLSITPEELLASGLIDECVKDDIDPGNGAGYVDRTAAIVGLAAKLKAAGGEKVKPSKAKKKRDGRKRSAAAKAAQSDAEVLPDSPRSPVSTSGDDELVSDDGGRYCKCNGPDNHRPMIACDCCNVWYHLACISMEEYEADLIDKYVCVCCDGPTLNTTYKVLCRLQGCSKPCDLAANPPSKYCSPAHLKKWSEQMVARCAPGVGPSRGGALTKGELKALLNHCDGDVKAFHALGKKPELPEGSETLDLDAFLTKEEKGRLGRIEYTRKKHLTSMEGYREKTALVRMVTSRMRKVVDENEELAGICGWDSILETNQSQFLWWRESDEGSRIFESGVLESEYCDRKHCKKHPQWIKNITVDINEDLARLQKCLDKLQTEEQTIRERCKVRAAIQQQQ